MLSCMVKDLGKRIMEEGGIEGAKAKVKKICGEESQRVVDGQSRRLLTLTRYATNEIRVNAAAANRSSDKAGRQQQ